MPGEAPAGPPPAASMPGPEGAEYSLTGLAVPEELDRLHDLLVRAASDHPTVPADAVMLMETAVMEVAGNVARHGRPVGSVQWRFQLAVGPGELTARLADSGEEYVETWTGEMPDLMAESGRGLPLAEATLHELRYERATDHNVWCMVRRFGADPAAPAQE